jgi:LysM repeat protein
MPMRAVSEAQQSVNPSSAAREAALRLAIAVLATLLMLVLWRPTVVHAQTMSASKAAAQSVVAAHMPQPPADTPNEAQAGADTLSAAHVVRAGETLWQLAERYYGDGHQWQELAKRNSLVTTNVGKVLLVGMKLRVPAKAPPRERRVAATKASDIPDVARAPAVAPGSANPSAGQRVSTNATSLSAQTVGKSDDTPVAPRTTGARNENRKVPGTAASRVAQRGKLLASDSSAPAEANKAGASTSALASGSASSIASATEPADLSPSKRTMLGAYSAPDTGDQDGQLAPPRRRMGLVDRDRLREARKASETPTVFIRVVPDAAELNAQARGLATSGAPLPRRAEYEAAPFTIDDAALRKAGRLTRRVGAAAGSTEADPDRLFIADVLEVNAPAGAALAAGDRLVSVHLADGAGKGQHVATPTGIIRITRVESGKPVLASVQSQVGSIEQGQPLLVIQGSAASPSVRATTIAVNDIETTVRWIDGAESLPTIQSYVLLGAGAAQGVKVGDEFELHTARPMVKGKPVPANGEDRIARARVVRIGDRESTAIIVRHERSGIAVGVPARRVARVP